MARVLATVSGTALKPGVSRNRRLYTREAIASAVSKAQLQLAEGAMPLRMLDPITTRTHHAAEDDSTRIVGRIRSLSVAEDGSARFTADIADTPHGRTIAALLDTSDGTEPFLKGVSIRGAWDGRVRRESGPDGQSCETASSLTLYGLDYTASPGVPGAEVDTFAWTDDGAKTETTERVLITESVQEAYVTAISEETAPDAGVIEAGAQTAAPPGTTYADPGYLKDGKKRYPLSNPARIRAAWSYINQKANAEQYTPAQLKRIKGKIKSAMVKLGAKITDENWTIWPAEPVTEPDLAETGGGSFSVCASNGPVNVSVSSYCIDPADLELILAAAATSAFAALKNLDPDMDADIDVPGAKSEDTDGDAAKESATTDPGGVTETVPGPAQSGTTPAPEPAAAVTNTKEGSAVSETTTTEAAQAPAALSRADIAQVVTETLDARDQAREAQAKAERKAAKKAAKLAAESAGATATVTESADERLTKLVDAKVAERLAAEGVTPVTETEDQKITRLVEEKVTAAKQSLTESGQGPARKGLITEHTATQATGGLFRGDGTPVKPLHELTDDEFAAVGNMMADHYLPPAPAREV